MELINRAELERKLARVLGRDLRAELVILMDHLGDPPDMANIPSAYWTSGWRNIQKDVEPILLGIYLQQADGLMTNVSIGVDWDAINTTASRWAGQHTEEILYKLFETRYEHLNETIPRFYEEGWTIGDLQENLSEWYDPVKAEMISITETTRAAVEGERGTVEQLMQETGIQMIPYWITSNDSRVCPICMERDGKPITDGVFPPLHPRCNCDVRWDYAERLT